MAIKSHPLKWWGGKAYLAKQLVALMPAPPAYLHYVEPYAGGLSVLLERDPEGTSEVVNDINRELTNFWRVLRDPESFCRFIREVKFVPFSQEEWADAQFAQYPVEGMLDVQAAIAFFVRCRQSRAGGFKDFATLSRNRVRRGMNEQVSAWKSAIAGLPEVSERLSRVVILSMPAIHVIQREDGDKTLFYLDPPYLPETRQATDAFSHDMSYEDHEKLLEVVKKCVGRVMLSGYPSHLYERELDEGSGWRRIDFQIDNKAAGGSVKRMMTESVWLNY